MSLILIQASSLSSSSSASAKAVNIKFTSFPQHAHWHLPDCDIITGHSKHQSSNDREFLLGDDPVNDQGHQMSCPCRHTVKPQRAPGGDKPCWLLAE